MEQKIFANKPGAGVFLVYPWWRKRRHMWLVLLMTSCRFVGVLVEHVTLKDNNLSLNTGTLQSVLAGRLQLHVHQRACAQSPRVHLC